MGDRFTSEQRAAIDASGKTIVAASAGSGKTTVMIEKIIRLIKSGVDVGEILAVTFTKKAAAQMKEKLCRALMDAVNAPETTAEKRAELKRQLSLVPTADISTIHAFCSKLIRTHFFAAGVDNKFRVIGGDDAEGAALKNAALDELAEEGYENKDEKFNHLLSVYWRKKSDGALRRILSTAYESLRCRADYREYLIRCSGGYTERIFDEICEELLFRLKEKCRYYQSLIEKELAYFEGIAGAPQIALSNELLGGVSEILACETYFQACGLSKPKFTAKRTNKGDSVEKREHIERLAFLKGKVAKIYDDELAKTLSWEAELKNFLLSGETAAALATYLLRFDDIYAELKAARGVLDYNDLEHKALALLKDAEIADETRKKYRYVFVDEYQDVNPVQEEIISGISGENLFLVGDVKQSIYGFRGSKSKFFAEKQKEFKNGGGTSLIMTRNFRSSDAVLDAVNRQFSLAMTPMTSHVDYANDSYMERGGRYALNDGKTQIHFLPKEEKRTAEKRGVYSVKENTGKRTVKESVSAKTIRHIIEKERAEKWYDPDTGEYRQVRYSDIAVLSRKKQGQIAQTVAALSAEGVPVTAAAAVNICEYAEVKTLIDILRLIDNAEQDIPLCSALLSAMGNMTADELTDIRLAYKNENFFRTACKKYASEKSDLTAYKLRKFFDTFEKYRTLSRVVDAAEILTRILAETRLEARLLSKENGVACTKRIHRFIEEAALPEPLCVHEFLERLHDLDYKIDYSENGGEDSVKVLTMHSSKGLEYPVVILDNLGATFRLSDRDEAYVEERFGLAPMAFDGERMVKSSTLLRRLHEARETESSIADELNLYYVALTRAKYSLHMVFDERPAMADVKYARSFAEFTDFSVWEDYVVQEEIVDLEKQERTALVFRPDEELTKKIMKAFTWKYAHTGAENLPVKSSATALMAALEKQAFAVDELGGAVALSAETERALGDAAGLFVDGEGAQADAKAEGLAYHAFLEYFDFSSLYGADKEKIPEIVFSAYGRFAAEYPAESGLITAERLTQILSNPVFAELSGMRLFKEQQFMAALPVGKTYANGEDVYSEAAKAEEVLFQGAIDLLAVGEKEVRIIDYKYSVRKPAELLKHYKTQLDLYRLAVAKIMRLPAETVRCTLVNIRKGYQIDVK